MSDLVGNPKDRFCYNNDAAHMTRQNALKLNIYHFPQQVQWVKVAPHHPELLHNLYCSPSPVLGRGNHQIHQSQLQFQCCQSIVGGAQAPVRHLIG